MDEDTKSAKGRVIYTEEIMNSEPHPDKNRRLTIISRISFFGGIVTFALSLMSLLALHINLDILPEDAIGPHPWIGYIGEWSLISGIYGSPVVILVSIISLVASIFKKPRVINITVTFIGLVMANVAMSTVLPKLDHIRAAPIRQYIYNMKGLKYMLQKYAAEYNGQLPAASNWCDLLIKCSSYSLSTLRHDGCKNDEGLSDYAFNASLSDMKLAETPKDVVLLFETKLAKNPAGGVELINAENHSLKGCFVLFGDMHIEFVRAEDFNDLRWKP